MTHATTIARLRRRQARLATLHASRSAALERDGLRAILSALLSHGRGTLANPSSTGKYLSDTVADLELAVRALVRAELSTSRGGSHACRAAPGFNAAELRRVLGVVVRENLELIDSNKVNTPFPLRYIP
jgi:hypothetical protein